jgi:hypothetical protein
LLAWRRNRRATQVQALLEHPTNATEAGIYEQRARVANSEGQIVIWPHRRPTGSPPWPNT